QESLAPGEAKDDTYWGLGNYEIKSATADGLTLRLFGYLRQRTERYREEIDDDCNGCGRDCNAVGPGVSAEIGATDASADRICQFRRRSQAERCRSPRGRRRRSCSSSKTRARSRCASSPRRIPSRLLSSRSARSSSASA